MTRFVPSIIVLASIAGSQAFTSMNTAPFGTRRATMVKAAELPFFANEMANADIRNSAYLVQDRMTIPDPTPVTPPPKPSQKLTPKNKPKAGNNHKEGLLSPFVILMKEVMGEAELNKLRGKVIGLHSDVIGKFVDTHETAFGQRVLKTLFALADEDSNGTVEEQELGRYLKSLGFDLKDKQIKGIFDRADKDDNGTIDLEEWMQDMPKTLRTNLIKLAKKNGGDMGLLA